jgi:hypothetical protein
VCYEFKLLPESLLYWLAFFVIFLRPHTWIRKRSGLHVGALNFLYSLGVFDSISILQKTLANKTFSTKYYVLCKSYLITALDRPVGLPGG